MNTTKTIKLYDTTPYETNFIATVIYCKKCTDRKTEHSTVYQLILDRTLFFPEEGGQTPDKGTINGFEVVDVQIREDVLTHYVSVPNDGQTETEAPFKSNDTVSGIVDWTHRFSNMQQHSAEHIFSGIVNRDYQLNNVGFHLSDNIVTMDYDGVLTTEQIEEVEWKVNQAIAQNIEIDARYPSKEELSGMQYRSKIEIDGPIRIVTIPGYDVCACCAPHVKRTGEIGMLKVMTVQNYKGGIRVSILCGFRALMAFREKNNVVSGLTNCLSAGQEQLLDRVNQLKDANQELKIQIGILKQNAMLGKIETIPLHQKHVIMFEEDLDTAIVRNVVNALVEKHEGNCALFTGNDTEGYRFILGSKTSDCKEIAVILRNHFGAKCGGSQIMIQGSLEGKRDDILQILTS